MTTDPITRRVQVTCPDSTVRHPGSFLSLGEARNASWACSCGQSGREHVLIDLIVYDDLAANLAADAELAAGAPVSPVAAEHLARQEARR